jgi:hypothetical protein
MTESGVWPWLIVTLPPYHWLVPRVGENWSRDRLVVLFVASDISLSLSLILNLTLTLTLSLTSTLITITNWWRNLWCKFFYPTKYPRSAVRQPWLSLLFSGWKTCFSDNHKQFLAITDRLLFQSQVGRNRSAGKISWSMSGITNWRMA